MVYLITNLLTGRKYVGRKYFWQNRKARGKSRRSKSASNWKDYYGSSDILLADIAEYGKENFKREILSLHVTRGGVNYTEVEEQITRKVLFTEEYYNETIGKYRKVNREKDLL